MRRAGRLRLPAPRVRFGSDFLGRVGRLCGNLRVARERREGAGQRGLLGLGLEFVGHRPYRPGEDPRAIDWNVLARTRRPYVRVARREANELWSLWIDASASMGVGDAVATGRPARGKLQLASEVALALAAVGLEEGAEVRLGIPGGHWPERTLRRRSALPGALSWFEDQEAQGRDGLNALVREAGRVRAGGVVFLVGDFLDVEPSQVLALGGAGRRLVCLQVLAPDELWAPLAEGVLWRDPETGAGWATRLDRKAVAAYEAHLERRLEGLARACHRHGAFHGVWSSRTPFEEVVGGLLGP